MTPRPSTAAPILAVLAVVAVVLVALGAYVAGYLWLGEYATNFDDPPAIYRFYKHRWQVSLFTPASRVEQLLKGVPVRCVVDE